jgi:glycosyltransferase involved in cell wall biosynthesis
MQQLPLVSIVVPSFNHAQFIDDCLNSVIKQTYSNWQCIIVDDGSIDQTSIVINKWVERDSRFLYIKKLNGGSNSARNVGISAAKGEFILPLDADDYIDATFLEKTISVLLSNNALGAVSSFAQCFGSNNFLWKPKGGGLIDFLIENNTSVTALFRKKIWEDIGGFDEVMKSAMEDWDFWIRMTGQGWYIQIIEEPLFYYRKTPGSQLQRSLKNIDTAMAYMVEKNKKYYQENITTILTNKECRITALNNEIAILKFEVNRLSNLKIYKIYNKISKLKHQLFRN